MIWSPYNEYKWVNMPQESSWPRDQLKNVRRVGSNDLKRFLSTKSFRAVSTLISEAVRSLKEGGGGLELYDLHFLRQIGSNGASFSRHQDIQDTGHAETTRLQGGLSLLLGGWGLDAAGTVDTWTEAWRIYFDPREPLSLWKPLIEEVMYLEEIRAPEPTYRGCRCHGSCVQGSCPCVKMGEGGSTSLLECHDGCGCGPSCGNRGSQSKSYAEFLTVRYSGEEVGWGVHSRKPIPKGGYVTSYLGEVLNPSPLQGR